MVYYGEQKRQYNRDWIRKRRSAWFDANGPCVRCGSRNDLELDHINPSTKIHHAIWSWADDRRLAELAKCQVLCRSCHVVKSVSERGFDRQHGHGTTMYSNGCRCNECRVAHANYCRAYRASKKLESTGSMAELGLMPSPAKRVHPRVT